MTFKSFLAVATLTILSFNTVTHTAVTHLNNETDFRAIINAPKAVVKFSAPWCGPCRTFAPIFERVSNNVQDVKFGSLDTDKVSSIANQYNVRSIPTTIFFKNGKEVLRIHGSASEAEFRNKVTTF